MPKFIFNLTVEEHAALKRQSADTGKPMAGYVRDALKVFLNGRVSCSVIISGAMVLGIQAVTTSGNIWLGKGN